MAGREMAAGTGGAVASQTEQCRFRIERVEREGEKRYPERRVVMSPKQTSSHCRAAMPDAVGQGAIEKRMSGWTPAVMTMDCAFQLSTLALSDTLRPQPVQGIAS